MSEMNSTLHDVFFRVQSTCFQRMAIFHINRFQNGGKNVFCEWHYNLAQQRRFRIAELVVGLELCSGRDWCIRVRVANALEGND